MYLFVIEHTQRKWECMRPCMSHDAQRCPFKTTSTAFVELMLNIKDRNPKVGPLSDQIRTWDRVADDYGGVYANLLMEREG